MKDKGFIEVPLPENTCPFRETNQYKCRFISASMYSLGKRKIVAPNFLETNINQINQNKNVDLCKKCMSLRLPEYNMI